MNNIPHNEITGLTDKNIDEDLFCKGQESDPLQTQSSIFTSKNQSKDTHLRRDSQSFINHFAGESM